MSLTVEKCLQAWTNSLRQMDAKADIVFFGDSLIYHGDFSSVFPDKVVCNLGLRGDTIQGMIDRVEQVVILDPKVVYLMAGINDITSLRLEEFGASYKRLVQQLQRQVSGIKLFIHTMMPINDIQFNIGCNSKLVISYNKIIKRLSCENELELIDTYSYFEKEGKLSVDMTIDGIHLTNRAYKKWYEILKQMDSHNNK